MNEQRAVCSQGSDKNALQPHKKECWVIPPEHDAGFAASMEDVPDTYEQPGQLIGEEKVPAAMKPVKNVLQHQCLNRRIDNIGQH
ncbi:MAG: hypothetical protein LBT46_09285 [Planctomycetaceae bacterium]|jgi:hypothetical protein|nr:hypothetical protein [Planctomycetaceae bacterium]